jgi:hypothetical protein
MSRIYKHIPGALLLAMLAACSSLPQSHATMGACLPAVTHKLDAADLLHYHACLVTLPPAQLASEYADVQREFAQNASPSLRLRLALLLSQPNAAFYDPAAAIRLLTTMPDATAPDLYALGELLRTSLVQQQQLASQVQGLQQALAAEKMRTSSLQNKIDSIKALERSTPPRTTP